MKLNKMKFSIFIAFTIILINNLDFFSCLSISSTRKFKKSLKKNNEPINACFIKYSYPAVRDKARPTPTKYPQFILDYEEVIGDIDFCDGIPCIKPTININTKYTLNYKHKSPSNTEEDITLFIFTLKKILIIPRINDESEKVISLIFMHSKDVTDESYPKNWFNLIVYAKDIEKCNNNSKPCLKDMFNNFSEETSHKISKIASNFATSPYIRIKYNVNQNLCVNNAYWYKLEKNIGVQMSKIENIFSITQYDLFTKNDKNGLLAALKTNKNANDWIIKANYNFSKNK